MTGPEYTAYLADAMYAILGAVVAASILIGGKMIDSTGRYHVICISWVGMIPILALLTVTSDCYVLPVAHVVWVSFDLIDLAAPVAK